MEEEVDGAFEAAGLGDQRHAVVHGAVEVVHGLAVVVRPVGFRQFGQVLLGQGDRDLELEGAPCRHVVLHAVLRVAVVEHHLGVGALGDGQADVAGGVFAEPKVGAGAAEHGDGEDQGVVARAGHGAGDGGLPQRDGVLRGEAHQDDDALLDGFGGSGEGGVAPPGQEPDEAVADFVVVVGGFSAAREVVAVVDEVALELDVVLFDVDVGVGALSGEFAGDDGAEADGHFLDGVGVEAGGEGGGLLGGGGAFGGPGAAVDEVPHDVGGGAVAGDDGGAGERGVGGEAGELGVGGGLAAGGEVGGNLDGHGGGFAAAVEVDGGLPAEVDGEAFGFAVADGDVAGLGVALEGVGDGGVFAGVDAVGDESALERGEAALGEGVVDGGDLGGVDVAAEGGDLVGDGVAGGGDFGVLGGVAGLGGEGLAVGEAEPEDGVGGGDDVVLAFGVGGDLGAVEVAEQECAGAVGVAEVFVGGGDGADAGGVGEGLFVEEGVDDFLLGGAGVFEDELDGGHEFGSGAQFVGREGEHGVAVDAVDLLVGGVGRDAEVGEEQLDDVGAVELAGVAQGGDGVVVLENARGEDGVHGDAGPGGLVARVALEGGHGVEDGVEEAAPGRRDAGEGVGHGVHVVAADEAGGGVVLHAEDVFGVGGREGEGGVDGDFLEEEAFVGGFVLGFEAGRVAVDEGRGVGLAGLDVGDEAVVPPAEGVEEPEAGAEVFDVFGEAAAVGHEAGGLAAGVEDGGEGVPGGGAGGGLVEGVELGEAREFGGEEAGLEGARGAGAVQEFALRGGDRRGVAPRGDDARLQGADGGAGDEAEGGGVEGAFVALDDEAQALARRGAGLEEGEGFGVGEAFEAGFGPHGVGDGLGVEGGQFVGADLRGEVGVGAGVALEGEEVDHDRRGAVPVPLAVGVDVGAVEELDELALEAGLGEDRDVEHRLGEVALVVGADFAAPGAGGGQELVLGGVDGDHDLAQRVVDLAPRDVGVEEGVERLDLVRRVPGGVDHRGDVDVVDLFRREDLRLEGVLRLGRDVGLVDLREDGRAFVDELLDGVPVDGLDFRIGLGGMVRDQEPLREPRSQVLEPLDREDSVPQGRGGHAQAFPHRFARPVGHGALAAPADGGAVGGLVDLSRVLVHHRLRLLRRLRPDEAFHDPRLEFAQGVRDLERVGVLEARLRHAPLDGGLHEALGRGADRRLHEARAQRFGGDARRAGGVRTRQVLGVGAGSQPGGGRVVRIAVGAEARAHLLGGGAEENLERLGKRVRGGA